MKVPTYNFQTKTTGETTLPKSIYSSDASANNISQSVRAYLSNHRSAHAKTKDRGEVAGTTKKMWSQKGTGRARHGSAKAGIFIGGGVAHGPTGQQNYSLKVSKKHKKLALKATLTQFAQNKCLLVIDKLSSIESKAKTANQLLTDLKKDNKTLSQSRKIGIIVSQPQPNIKRAFGNLKNISLLSTKSLNTYDLTRQNFLIFTLKAIKSIK